MVEDGNSGEKNCWRKSLFLFCLREKSEVSQKWCWVKSEAVTWTASSMSLLCFWTWEHFSCYAVYGWSENCQISSKYLNLCSEDEQRSYGFRTTWGRVINDRIFILGWTNLLTWWANQKTHHPLHQHIKGRPVRGLLYDGFSGCWRSRPLIVSRCRGTCRRERGPLAARLVWPLLAQSPAAFEAFLWSFQFSARLPL